MFYKHSSIDPWKKELQGILRKLPLLEDSLDEQAVEELALKISQRLNMETIKE